MLAAASTYEEKQAAALPLPLLLAPSHTLMEPIPDDEDLCLAAADHKRQKCEDSATLR